MDTEAAMVSRVGACPIVSSRRRVFQMTKRIRYQRRDFMRCLSGAMLGAGCGGLGTMELEGADAGKFAGRIKIAVKYHMIREEGLSVVEKFRLLKEVGLDGTELKTNEKVDPEEVVRAIEETGVPVHGVVNSSDPDISGAVELAKFYGGDSVLVLAAEDERMSYEENFQRWQALMHPAIPLAREHGIKLCIENVRATFLKTAEGMVRFIDSFEAPDVVRSYFDTGNTITWTEQSAEHWARVLKKRIYKLDIKDRGHVEFGDNKLAREGVTTGTNGGEVNWKGVREELDEVGFMGWATAEVVGGGRERLAGIAGWMRDVLDA
jgi:L-ribulose-5-phosphate 3-epimerase